MTHEEARDGRLKAAEQELAMRTGPGLGPELGPGAEQGLELVLSAALSPPGLPGARAGRPCGPCVVP